MNILSSNSIQNLLHGWKDFSSAVKTLSAHNAEFPCGITGLHGCLKSFFISEYIIQKRMRCAQAEIAGRGSAEENLPYVCDIFIVVQNERDAEMLKTDLATIIEDAEVSILPGWGTLPYRPAAPGNKIFGERAVFLCRLLLTQSETHEKNRPHIFIAVQRVLLTPLTPPQFLRPFIFDLQKGQKIDTQEVSAKLVKSCYVRVPKVSARGEFSLRGEVLDIFLPAGEDAVRIVFDFDKIEEIKTFDIETQTTTGSTDSVLISPMKEVLWNAELVSVLEERLKNGAAADNVGGEENLSNIQIEYSESAQNFRENLLLELEETGQSEGEEIFYPVLWDKKYSVFDYIPSDMPVFFFDYDRLCNANESLSRELFNSYKTAVQNMCVPLPSAMSLEFESLVKNIKESIFFYTIDINNFTQTEKSHIKIAAEPAQSYFGNIKYLKEELEKSNANGWTSVIFADNPNQALRISEILKDVTETSDGKKTNISIIGKAVSEGFAVPDIKLRIIQENEIFGRRKYVPKSIQKAKSTAIDTFVDLTPGDYIVHVNYGIGIFCGIDRVKAGGNERDYVKLEYADKEFVFVPIEQVNMVQRYVGNAGNAPHLDRLGSKAWENRKNKVKQAVEDLAGKLIDLYSRRKAAHGFPFPKDTEWQTMFEAAFPYEDTDDQIIVTEEIKKDMESASPMDRLVCGDVGYGKTEIAMRAAFKAVMGGRQVAFLAPTTILAEQHYETCIERFKNFPVRIAQMSRFIPPKEQKETLKKLKDGQIDILIGTHRIIQKDVVFKNLGLMIIDEEQRFGVKDKEKLKVLRNNIDSLALSATPIPRTLHMSLLKIRDMSLLTTPPKNRQPIETVVDGFTDERVASAIRKEAERGGQIFYLHNRVESLEETRIKLERLVPEMLIETAHGKMTADELDDIFRRFKLGGFNVLVSTTIIENGIDIPNVNTIIIDRADMYGVSQLYQLRGRVGRSDRKAYAYLLSPENKVLSEDAMKRLQVISDFTELGSGFKIAMKDMEIRGAGNLLGRDQAGNVYSVGFDMYVRLLNDAVNRLVMQEEYKAENEVLLELEYTGFIPDSYVHNPQTKMEIYKKIAAVQTQDELDGVFIEVSDRFGPLPDEVNSLMSLASIRILCRRLNISSIKEKSGVAAVSFEKVSDISIDKVLRLIKESSGSVKLDSAKPNGIFLNTGNITLKEKSEFIREKLERIV